MRSLLPLLLGAALLGVTAGCSSLRSLAGANPPPNASDEVFAVTFTDAQWDEFSVVLTENGYALD